MLFLSLAASGLDGGRDEERSILPAEVKIKKKKSSRPFFLFCVDESMRWLGPIALNRRSLYIIFPPLGSRIVGYAAIKQVKRPEKKVKHNRSIDHNFYHLSGAVRACVALLVRRVQR